MHRFAVKHPIIFEIILFAVGLLIALAFIAAGSILYLPTELGGAIGRIIAGVLIFLAFIRYFDIRRQFSGLLIALPAAALQAFYATVIGISFGAIYIRRRDFFSLVLIHAAIDITNRIFIGGDTTPVIVYILFIILLIAEAGYAAWLVLKASWHYE